MVQKEDGGLMDLSFYLPGSSVLHRMPTWSKFFLLISFSILFYAIEDLRILAVILAAAIALVVYVRVPVRRLKAMFLLPLFMVLLFSIFSAFVNDLNAGLLTFFRLTSLVIIAACVTVTTRIEDFMAFIENLLLPLSFIPFIKPKTVSLTLSLTLRFIPEIFKLGMDIKEAQAARGLNSNPLALIVPLIVLTLKRADDISDAIDARMLD
ncbi:MAG: energy-coupling factor transporter transmembrane protein EcfT [Rhizobiaceae bacterium]|nr:energy-coupling factor transporter transmembrane protein EcfT [Rhizobiaceae bacterium]